jgi:hypothetical protein
MKHLLKRDDQRESRAGSHLRTLDLSETRAMPSAASEGRLDPAHGRRRPLRLAYLRASMAQSLRGFAAACAQVQPRHAARTFRLLAGLALLLGLDCLVMGRWASHPHLARLVNGEEIGANVIMVQLLVLGVVGGCFATVILLSDAVICLGTLLHHRAARRARERLMLR